MRRLGRSKHRPYPQPTTASRAGNSVAPSVKRPRLSKVMFDGVSSAVWEYLLPQNSHHPEPPIPPKQVSLVAIRIRYLIEELISAEIKVTLE
jgi:hypothetical protein